MNTLESLLKPWPFLPLNAPALVWVAAAAIFGITIWQGLRLLLAVSRERKLYERASRRFAQVFANFKPKPKSGLSEEGYEALRAELENQPELRSIWRNYLDELICERDADGRDNYWSEGSVADAFAKAAGFGSRINWKWFGAVPGFVTGLGLLVTFVAILFALADLHADPASGKSTASVSFSKGSLVNSSRRSPP